MPDRNAILAASRIAVVDVGSNSLRLVVFERLGATLLTLLNEKVMCGLGRGIGATGRLHPDGVAMALGNLERFVAVAHGLGVDHLAILATAAVREASDGAEFAAEAERRCGVPVRIIAGIEEAMLSAAGVIAGIPNADGIVGDLGGGSVELVQVSAAGTGAAGRDGFIGPGVTLPLGPLRLAEWDGNPKALGEAIDRAVTAAPVVREAAGKSLYLVGGAWRAIARLHMEQNRYPLHIIHEYTISRRSAETFIEVIGRLSRRSLERITTINRKRLEVVPLAALILRKLLAAGRPERVVFSAFGLREGYAYGLIPREARLEEDPLVAACIGMATSISRLQIDGDLLQRWTEPVFAELSAAARRRHRAACWLSDFAWSEHPDYRAAQAFARSLNMPFAGLGHADRVFIATALHARYGGAADDPIKSPTRGLLDAPMTDEARSLGLALRLAYTLCGGAVGLLSNLRLRRESHALTLDVPPSDRLCGGEAVQRRLDALARSLGLAANVDRSRTRHKALV